MGTGDPVIDYWDRRYRTGGNSGPGSQGALAQHKAGVVNELIARYAIESVSEFGCGDGSQTGRLSPNVRYYGYDVSKEAIAICQKKFSITPRRHFFVLPRSGQWLRTPADMSLSLDVIYHIIDDDDFRHYMADLFDTATKLVVIYSSNMQDQAAGHVRHRVFTDWVVACAPDWSLWEHIPQPWPELSSASFFVFAKRAARLLR